MTALWKPIVLGSGVILAGWIAWGLYSSRSAKSVPYEQLHTLDGVELRHYPQTILAETTASTERAAFRRLFEYISGANQTDESISMTAPVATQDGESIAMTAPVRSATTDGSDDVTLGFYLPSEYKPDTAPEPTDSDVDLVIEPPKTVAVDRFSWITPDWRVRRRTRKLRSTLEREGIEPIGDPTLLRYNDPWTPPFMRRNEIAVEIKESA
jgi:hypothetical protein